MPDLLGSAARFTQRWAAMIVLGWIAAAALANLAVPQLERVVAAHSRAFIPGGAPSVAAGTHAAQQFDEPPGNNFCYVVLERDKPLQAADRSYYDSLVTSLHADIRHVDSVTDLWSAPVTAPLAQSRDGGAVSLMLQLPGMIGTSAAADAVNAVRATMARLDPPAGLHVYLTGPGASISDELAAIDNQMLAITAATVLVIMALLLIVYRSAVAAAVPLIAVGLGLGVARPLVALLGSHGIIEVSLFTVALLAAMVLGTGTDFAIFLIGRYQEGRRRGIESTAALTAAVRGVAPVIVGSASTVSAALACLSLAKIGMFRSTGIPCAIGISMGMLAALTLTPALIALAARRGWLEPGRSRTARRWRRIGVMVARWPAPILAATLGLIVVLMLPVAGIRAGWNEPSATPADTESNRGYAAMDRHFPVNTLLPAVVTVAADHDLRNPAGLIAVERITRGLMALPGVRMVQSASRPAGTVPKEATLSYQAGLLGQRLGDGFDSLSDRLARFADLDAMLTRLDGAVDRMGSGMASGANGMRVIGSAATDLRSGMEGLQTSATTLSGYLDPLRDYVDATPDCPTNPICSIVQRVLEPVDSMVRSSTELSGGAAQLTAGSAVTTSGMAQLPPALQAMRDVLSQARDATGELRGAIAASSPQLRQLTDFLHEIDTDFRASAAGGFYLPDQALVDPRYREALTMLISPDGRATRLLVFGAGEEWGVDGAQRARQIDVAVAETTKEGTLTPVSVDVVGVGAFARDLQGLVRGDVTLLAVSMLALIFGIVLVMVRSPVAALAVVGTVIVSYASALGISVLTWQHLVGQPLHWAVAPVAFIALVAVGADYNLLLTLRIREESGAGIRTGLVRAFAGTGGVVTIAGIVFGLTMLALVASSVTSIAQIGVTVSVGLLLDTLVVRTFLMPALVVMLGRWFWWPRALPARTRRRSQPGQRSGVADALAVNR